MLRQRTVLESPTVDLPQRDQNSLLVMSVGDNDLFGPDARKVHEWKRGWGVGGVEVARAEIGKTSFRLGGS